MILNRKKGTYTGTGMDNTFGNMVDFDIPEDCDAIILMGNSGGGWQPFRFLLPHQVYREDLIEEFKSSNYEMIGVIPIRSNDAFYLAWQNEYGKQRWRDTKKKGRKVEDTNSSN